MKFILVSPNDVEEIIKVLDVKDFTRETVKIQRDRGIEGYWYDTKVIKTPHCREGEILFPCERCYFWARVKLGPKTEGPIVLQRLRKSVRS